MSEPPPGAPPYALGPPGPPPGDPRRRRKVVDRVVGILLGVVIGVAVIALFIFLGGQGAIDAPSVSGTTTTGTEAPAQQAEPVRPQADR